MINVSNYNTDGADPQSRAVLAMLQDILSDGIEESWNPDMNRYEAAINVARWENCREQGYILTMRSKDFSEQLNIAFFTHRNSDEICAVKWNQKTVNSPTIDTAEFGDVYTDKYDVSNSVQYGHVIEMAQWIFNECVYFWKATKTKSKDTP